MRPTLRLAITVAACAFAQPALAQDSTPSSGIFKDAKDLYPLCTSKVEEDTNVCDWYLMGAYDMATYFYDTSQAERDFCPSPNRKATEVRQAVVAYWEKKPDSRKYSAVSTMINALSEAFLAPCKK